ncbi:PHD finger protein 20 isoform X1 [Bufo bufo]|uniref:PHD finger protein 20 isoform X1 n=1 Tax=Bufo bufo TaxID=8384 RepID=UPI001ABE0298|nr:PHD finger protein 20 isoform X1 [Bufo bufo]XP_040291737.1 PHD finger protein 20 isoform X1 [Bufo bufo]
MTKHPPNRRGISFEVGAQLEARDRLKKWYAAHIEEIDYEEGKVLIHFKRWNHRYDEWFCWDSPYLRPLEKIQLRREGLVEDEATVVFRVNEQVLACWSDCRFYPAKITSVNKDGTYTVKFFDGVIQTVKNIHVKAFSKEQANAARPKHRERPTENTTPSDKHRGKFREQRKSSENTTIEKEKPQTTEKRAVQSEKEKKPAPCEKSKVPAVKNEKEDKENISENDRDSSAETRPEERGGHNDSLKVPHENGERRRKRDRSSSLTSDPGSQTLQPVTLELRRRKISIASETHTKRPRLEKKKNVSAATSVRTENVSDGEQPRAESENEKDPKAEHLLPSKSQEDLTGLDVPAETAPEKELVHQNGPALEQEVKTKESAPVDHVKPKTPEEKGLLPLEDVVEPSAENESTGLPDIKTNGHESELPGPNEIQMITTLSAPMKRNPRSDNSAKYSREPLTNTLKKPDDPAAKAVTLELDANRFKCKILDCSKSFRKAKLLHYHLKYFHGVEKAEQDQMSMTRHMQTRGSLAHEKNSQQTSKRRRTTSGSLHTPFQISLRSSPHDGKDLICEKRRHSSPATNSSSVQRPTLKEKSKENQIQKSCRKPEKGSDSVKDKVKEKFNDLLSLKSKKKKKKRIKSELSGSEENVDISKELSPKKTNSIKLGTDYNISCSIKTSDHMKRRDTPRLSDEETLSDSCTESLLWSDDDDDDYNEEIDVTNADEDMEDDEAECEIVRCMCEVQEENDFMIQCEECLCWQHGVCMGLLEDTVPEKYTCYICQDPPGQRVSLKYWYDKEWLNEGHMHGLSFLEENYSHQNAKKIVATHQLLGDVQRVIEVLHGLQLKMSILQSKEHPDLRFWGQPWKQHTLNDRCYIRRTVEENSCKEDSTNYRTYNGAVDKPSPIPSVEESYITSEHCYQKPRTYYPAVEQRLVVETRSSSLDGGVDRIRQNREDSIAERLGWELDRELLKVESESKHNYCKVRECLSKRNIPQESPHAQPADNGDAAVSSQIQWQLNLLTHLEALQEEVTHRMDFIEKELDVLESFLDYTGELEPPEPLARLPQLKHRIKQLLMDLGKVEQIALCST